MADPFIFGTRFGVAAYGPTQSNPVVQINTATGLANKGVLIYQPLYSTFPQSLKGQPGIWTDVDLSPLLPNPVNTVAAWLVGIMGMSHRADKNANADLIISLRASNQTYDYEGCGQVASFHLEDQIRSPFSCPIRLSNGIFQFKWFIDMDGQQPPNVTGYFASLYLAGIWEV